MTPKRHFEINWPLVYVRKLKLEAIRNVLKSRWVGKHVKIKSRKIQREDQRGSQSTIFLYSKIYCFVYLLFCSWLFPISFYNTFIDLGWNYSCENMWNTCVLQKGANLLKCNKLHSRIQCKMQSNMGKKVFTLSRLWSRI